MKNIEQFMIDNYEEQGLSYCADKLIFQGETFSSSRLGNVISLLIY